MPLLPTKFLINVLTGLTPFLETFYLPQFNRAAVL
jgi:hypothetical protein